MRTRNIIMSYTQGDCMSTERKQKKASLVFFAGIAMSLQAAWMPQLFAEESMEFEHGSSSSAYQMEVSSEESTGPSENQVTKADVISLSTQVGGDETKDELDVVACPGLGINEEESFELAEYIAAQVQRFGKFVYRNVPNRAELAIDLCIVVPLEVLITEIGLLPTSNNPSSKSYQRDTARLISLLVKINRETPVAGTGFTYDRSHVWSQFSKPALKLPVLFVGGKLLGFSDDLAGIAANSIGDVVARALVTLGENHQKFKNQTGSNLSFEDYVRQNATVLPILASSIMEVVPKVGAMAAVGKVLVALRINQALTWLVYAPINLLAFGLAGGNVLQGHLGFRANVQAGVGRGLSPSIARMIAGGTMATSMALKYVVNTVVLSTIAKSIMNGIRSVVAMAHQEHVAHAHTAPQAPKENKESVEL